MISLRNYLKMDSSAMREILMRGFLPRDVRGEVSLVKLPHEAFSLNDHMELFDPEKNLPFQRGKIEGFIMDEVVSWPSSGIVRTANKQSIYETYFDPRDIRVAKKQKHLLRFPMQYSKIATSIGHIYRNYFHKHIDSIPRLYSLQHPDLLALPSIDLFLDPRYTPEELEIIHCLLPDNVKVKQVEFTTRVQADRQVFLPFLSQDRAEWSGHFKNCAGYLPNEYIQFYRGKIDALWSLPEGKPEKRVFISRKKAAIRRINNEDEIMRFLGPLGFELYELESLSIREQANLFARTDILVAQHGASLTNLLYGKPEMRVVEIFSGKKLKIYETLANAMKMDYFPIAVMSGGKNEDIDLPLALLERTMEAIL